MAAYTDSLDHLRHELVRLDLLLEREVARFRGTLTRERAETPFAGLYISDAEIDTILGNGAGPEGDRLAALDARIAELTATIDARLAESRASGVPLRLLHLADTFNLARTELDIIVLALAPELDLRYQKLYAYVQDDVSRKRPTIDLALRLFCRTETERIACRRIFSDLEPLAAVPLLSRWEEPGDRPAPLIGHALKLEERIAEFLIGGDYMESRFANRAALVRWVIAATRLDDLVLPDVSAQRLRSLARLSADADRRWICVLEGPSGSGKKAAAEAVCAELRLPMLVADAAALGRNEIDVRAGIRAVLREARLYGGAVYIDSWASLATAAESGPPVDVHSPLETLVLEELARFGGPIFIGTRGAWRPAERAHRWVVHVRLGIPNERDRLLLWGRALERHERAVEPGIAIDYLDGAYRFTGGRIGAAMDHAGLHARLRDADDGRITNDDLVAGCRAESARFIISFAKKLSVQRTWNDLVLPPDVALQLREFARQVKHRARVYGEWGFDRKLSAGKGTIAMFTGNSGTGKTLSAEVMAHELGLDLFRVDLSSVISKYIGETEKNLDRVFQDAQDSNAILFFDEADALFGKRSEVKDAHDRYANIEINYLLQRVEEYEGVIILATNLSKNIDQAFLRRLHFAIEFPFPDEPYRKQIWERIFPKAVPIDSDVDFEFLARQFKIAGGNIKNVALAAAFHAADDNTGVQMRHLVLALKREFQKQGKTCERTDFEQYYELVR